MTTCLTPTHRSRDRPAAECGRARRSCCSLYSLSQLCMRSSYVCRKHTCFGAAWILVQSRQHTAKPTAHVCTSVWYWGVAARVHHHMHCAVAPLHDSSALTSLPALNLPLRWWGWHSLRGLVLLQGDDSSLVQFGSRTCGIGVAAFTARCCRTTAWSGAAMSLLLHAHAQP